MPTPQHREPNSLWRLAVICPNPALDVTAATTAFSPGDNIAGAETAIRAGGKGTNVACTASDLGASATLVAPLGGSAGAGFEHMLDARISLQRVAVSGPTRICLTLTAPDSISEIRGRGPALSDGEWDAFTDAAQAAASAADAAVVSGSFPPGIPASRVDQIVSSLNCPNVYVDTSGGHLAAAACLADLTIAPNFDELCELAGSGPRPLLLSQSDRSRYAARLVAQLQQRSGVRVLATLGEAGAGLLAGHRWYVAAPPEVKGNPVGAGDAALAPFIGAEVSGLAPEAALKRAAAAGAAAVAQSIAGRVEPEVVERYESQTRLLEFAADQAGVALG